MIQIIYSDVAPGADNDATYSGQTQSYALLDNLSAGASPCLIATGEPGRWKLDGSVDILGYVDADYGYVSAAQSNTSGKYAAGIGLDVTLTGSYTSSGLTILFDPFEDVRYALLPTAMQSAYLPCRKPQSRSPQAIFIQARLSRQTPS